MYLFLYYLVLQIGMVFKDIQYMILFFFDEFLKREEEIMKDWVENYCFVCQRIVRSEIIKDKVGVFFLVVYFNLNIDVIIRVFF